MAVHSELVIDALGRRAGWLVVQMDGGGGGVDIDVSLGEGLAGGAGSTVLLTLVVRAILVAVAPAYTERTMDVVRDDPVNSFLYGLVSLPIGVTGFGVVVSDALD